MVADAIRDEAMPPDDAKQLSEDERQLILNSSTRRSIR